MVQLEGENDEVLEFAEEVAAILALSLLWIDLGKAPDDPMDLRQWIKKCIRDATLHDALIYFEAGKGSTLMTCIDLLKDKNNLWMLHKKEHSPGSDFFFIEIGR